MRRRGQRRWRALVMSVILGLMVGNAGGWQQPAYTREEAEAFNAMFGPAREGKLAEAIRIAEEFLAKYPQSVLASRAKQQLVFWYIQTNNLDKAFERGADVLNADPTNFGVTYYLAVAAAEASKGGNKKFDQQGLTYAQRALDVVTGGATPPGVDPARWEQEKPKALALLYQAVGLFLHNKGEFDAAIESLTKAGELEPKDPVTPFLIAESYKLGSYKKLQESYDKLTAEEKVADAGKKLLEEVDQIVDKMIEIYARVVALSESDARFQTLGQVARATLEGFYKYRHNNTTDGLEDLIKKYKPTPSVG